MDKDDGSPPMRLPKPTREGPMDGGTKLSQLRLKCLCILVTLGALAQPTPAAPIDVGQIDDFQDGTTQGWGSGFQNPNPPVNAADVGPEGIGDHSLLITSTGMEGPGGRLVAFNLAQWSGDYLTAEVDRIVMDVNNVGITNLDLRLGFDGAGGRFASTVSVPLDVGSGWQTVVFPIGAASLTAEPGEGFDADATLADVTELRVLSAASPSFRADPIVADLLVDNIAVPEPSRSLLLAAGLSALLLLARRRVNAKGT